MLLVHVALHHERGERRLGSAVRRFPVRIGGAAQRRCHTGTHLVGQLLHAQHQRGVHCAAGHGKVSLAQGGTA